MLGAAIGRAEGHDLGIGRQRQWQPCAARQANTGSGGRQRQHRSGGGRDHRRGGANGNGIDRRQQRRMFGKRDRSVRSGAIHPQPACRERAFQWRRQIEHRIGNRTTAIKIEPGRPFDPHRFGISRRRGALVGQHQDRGTPRCDDEAGASRRFENGQRGGIGKFGGQDRQPASFASDADHASAPQRVDRGFGGDRGVTHRSNVAICGTWSEGLPQSRASSMTSKRVAARATSGEAQI